jgi:hypothetical protein
VSGLGLDQLDRDGALRGAASARPPATRRAFLARAGAGAAAALVGGLAAAEPGRAQGGGSDVSILNYALTLEYLQAAFYTEAERLGALGGISARAAGQIGAIERAHVDALRQALGADAVARPAFDFGETTSDDDAFLRTAVAFEDLGTAAYKGQLGNLRSRQYLAAALSIHTVEARHAAWIRYLAGRTPAAQAEDEPITRAEAERIVASTGFVVSAPATTSDRAPSFTG